MDNVINALLWFAVVSVGLMAGIYYTFSAFVMRSLDAVEAPAGMLAMQSINRIIVKSSFLPIFFASTAICTGLVGLALFDLEAAGAMTMLAGGGIYLAGMFIVTVAANVPLNNQLEATQAYGSEGPDMWSLYLKKWTMWNHVRTISCTASMILLMLAITARV